jgi:glycine betaine/proline transport system ATP-binding protein
MNVTRSATKAAAALDERPVMLASRNVWKVYGRGAEEVMAAKGGTPSAADLNEAGLIGAVRDASVEVKEGEIFIIMGLSGSGKSTLLRCMSRLIEPTAGEVMFDGRNLLQVSEKELIEIRRHRMGMVFQHFALLPHLTVLENVAFPLSVQGKPRTEQRKRAQEMVELVGLKGRENYYPRELSGGQQQRVGIARSLAVEPQIWFLDEPFSALDPLIRRERQQELMRLQNVLHKTIVFITHDFDEAIRLADRIAIMKDGEIIQICTPADLVTRPATDYVAEFTRDVQRAKVLSARTLMSPLTGDAHATRPTGEAGTLRKVAATAKIASFAAEIVAEARPFAVTDPDGAVIGQVTPAAVINLLAGREGGL